MAKAKSPKLRTLITLHALFKHTDEHHRLNSVKLNDFLRPYGLECNKKVLMDTAERLIEAGIGVELAGGGPYKGLCLTSRPLPDHELKRMVFAIETNPFVSKEQAQELIQALVPAVTVYQEPMLCTSVEESTSMPIESNLLQFYSMIHEAISTRKRVCITLSRWSVDVKAKKLCRRNKKAITFTPRYLTERDGSFYTVGYNHARQRIEAIVLKDIANIRIAQYNKLPEMPGILAMLDSIDPYEYLPEKPIVIYEGPAVFYCGAKYLQLLYDRFGAPAGPVQRDKRCRLTYPVSQATITPNSLQWLSNLPGRGIRIIGPEGLLEAVRAYYDQTTSQLLGCDK